MSFTDVHVLSRSLILSNDYGVMHARGLSMRGPPVIEEEAEFSTNLTASFSIVLSNVVV